jgi:hypothetical protein
MADLKEADFKLRHDLEIEDKKMDYELSTCCCHQTTDKRLLRFGIQLAVTVGILGFCFAKLFSPHVQCPEANVLYSLISGISGFWLTKL